MIHVPHCQTPTQDHSDAAKRLYDTYALHRIADPIGNIGKFFAVKIADGKTDGVLYDSRLDAMRGQKHNEMYCAYVQIVPSTMSVCDAELFLSGWRKMYDARRKMMDLDHRTGGMEIIPRLTAEDQIAQVNGILRNLILPGRN